LKLRNCTKAAPERTNLKKTQTQPIIIFTPRKEKEKKQEKKEKDSFQLRRLDRLSRFLRKILPEVKRGVEIFFKTRRA